MTQSARRLTAADDSAARRTSTLTFLFTDIEGSTRRWEHSRDAMRSVCARFGERFTTCDVLDAARLLKGAPTGRATREFGFAPRPARAIPISHSATQASVYHRPADEPA